MDRQKEDIVDWYDKNAQEYFESTKDFLMHDKYPQFLKHIPTNSEILDVGCGSGRDTKEFSKLGYKVTAFDASEELVKLASKNTGLQILHTKFEEFKSRKKFDGIWANATLLHVPKKNFEKAFINLFNHLKINGVFYLSMKYGKTEEKDSNGRFFNYVSPKELKNIFNKYANITILEIVRAKNTFRINDKPFVIFIIKRNN